MTSHQTLRERFEEMIGPNDLILKNKEFGTIIDTSGNLNKTVLAFIESELSSSATKIREEERVTEDTSDGYHTFKELYEFRKLYNAAFFNELYTTDLLSGDNRYNVHKSKRHSDGEECFGGGWFIVMATLPTGQISNHYELKDWDMFDCAAREVSEKWDGHTPQDVINRLTAFLLPSEGESNKQ